MKQIDNVIVPKTHSPLYMVHKYWARKPDNVVRAYIENFTSPGEIVLDPFVGSGVTAIEAIKAGRKAVAIDLNPMATFITKCSVIPCDIGELKKEFKHIGVLTKNKILELYKTSCPDHPHEETKVICGIWEGSELTDIWVDCAKEGAILRPARRKDRKRCVEIEASRMPGWAPDFKFPRGVVFDQAIREAGDSLKDLFTPRAWYALSLLREAISRVNDESNRALMLLTFTSMLAQVSRMVPQREGARLSGNVGWTVNSYWVPPKSREFNVWDSFANRFNRVVQAKEQSNKELETRIGTSFDELINGDANILILNKSALDLADLVPPESIDYVFTDPPYGGSIPYLELSTLWAEWAKGKAGDPAFTIDLSEEITVDPKYQKKDFSYYHQMLRSVFRQIHKCLKSDRCVTVTFHNQDIQVWNSIVEALSEADLSMEKILYQPPPRASIGGLSRPYGSAIGDYYLSLKKGEEEERKVGTEGEQLYERIVVETAKRVIAERGESTPYTFILNSMVPALKKAGVFLASKKNWDQVLREHLGSDFVLKDVQEDGKVVGQNWALAHPEEIPYLDIVPLSERVEMTVIDILTREVKATFDEILQDVFIKFPNSLTPTTKTVLEVVEGVAQKTRDGQWQLRPDIRKRESEHSLMIRYLAELGMSKGFIIYAAPPAPGLEGVLPTLPETVSIENRDRVAMVDVLWIKDDDIKYAFEVENTTGFIAAIARCSNLSEETRRFMVLPEERIGDLERRLEDPSVARDYENYGWRRIFYNRLEELMEGGKVAKMSLEEVLEYVTENPMMAKFGAPVTRETRRSKSAAKEQLGMILKEE